MGGGEESLAEMKAGNGLSVDPLNAIEGHRETSGDLGLKILGVPCCLCGLKTSWMVEHQGCSNFSEEVNKYIFILHFQKKIDQKVSSTMTGGKPKRFQGLFLSENKPKPFTGFHFHASSWKPSPLSVTLQGQKPGASKQRKWRLMKFQTDEFLRGNNKRNPEPTSTGHGRSSQEHSSVAVTPLTYGGTSARQEPKTRVPHPPPESLILRKIGSEGRIRVPNKRQLDLFCGGCIFVPNHSGLRWWGAKVQRREPQLHLWKG